MSSAGCPTELPNSMQSFKVEAMQLNTALSFLTSAIRYPPSMTPASEKQCYPWMASLGGALYRDTYQGEGFWYIPSLALLSIPQTNHVHSLFLLYFSPLGLVSLFTRMAHVAWKVCIYCKKTEIYFLNFIWFGEEGEYIPQITKKSEFWKHLLKKNKKNFQTQCNFQGKKKERF